MKIASKVGFKNNRYLKNDEQIFENELTNIIVNRFNKANIELQINELLTQEHEATKLILKDLRKIDVIY